ncbi:uncharacterized protein LACBIDRAFT_329545 [Laccaria bicolor S238N-H82]|uniref:Predicted protein n=1 Tax=Laccaria bicolor (strain S238N-H82 / ATCC MYA-4686) TaxID=486041 RepID=B0DID6_LACBS|nr:uncharacterized protein LACBIDRAFT_329545 [Laccaria bicolor S238N-H82]EDR05671.1 predicted protein [Laccaria bicolor S238N-H82]|eukprot:XP_001883775.1 predicted protein [Laccaria bicolor S238N-H82]
MTLAHRTEVLDAHMGDHNWKKLVNMVRSLCQRWKRTTTGLAEAETELHKLSDTASSEELLDWNRQEENAQKLRTADPSAMDIFEAEAPKVLTQKDVQASLMAKELDIRNAIGFHLDKHGYENSGNTVGIKFIRQLDAFHRQGSELFPWTDFLDACVLNPPPDDQFEHDNDLDILDANPPKGMQVA